MNEKDYSKGILSLMFFRINFLPDLAGKVMSKKAEYVSTENTWYTWKHLGQGNNTILVSTILKPRPHVSGYFWKRRFFFSLLAFLPRAPNRGFPVSGGFSKRLIIVFAKKLKKSEIFEYDLRRAHGTLSYLYRFSVFVFSCCGWVKTI